MLGQFPRKLNPAFIFGFANYEVKCPNSFVKKLESSILVSDELNKHLDDCKKNPNDISIRSSGDANACTPTNCIFEFCISKDIPILLDINNLKNGSFCDFVIQSHCKSTLNCGSTSAQFHLKPIFDN